MCGVGQIKASGVNVDQASRRCVSPLRASRGCASILAWGSIQAAAWIVTCVVLPVASEVIQHFDPALMHSCQVADVEDNWQGVLMGAILGVVVLVIRWLWGRSKPKPI